MKRMAGVTGLLAGLLLAGGLRVAAEVRPIEQLPKDVVRWSMLWVEIPQEMAKAGQAYGPLAALTVGPAMGTANILDSTAKELWAAAKGDKRPGRQHRGNPNGPLFQYEF